MKHSALCLLSLSFAASQCLPAFQAADASGETTTKPSRATKESREAQEEEEEEEDGLPFDDAGEVDDTARSRCV